LHGDGAAINACVKAAASASKELQKLYLLRNNIDVQGAQILAAQGRHWEQLQELHLSGNKIGDAGLAALAAAAPYWSQLEYVILDDNGVSDDGVVALAQAAPHWKHIEWLGLRRNADIGDRGIIALAEVAAPHWQQLGWLGLSCGNEVSAVGMQVLAGAATQHWKALYRLDLVDVDAGCLLSFCEAAAPHCKKLSLSYNLPTASGEKKRYNQTLAKAAATATDHMVQSLQAKLIKINSSARAEPK
jgi:Ran GTPase-activating protein (RanGAP) involved in mRNA processing and transport